MYDFFRRWCRHGYVRELYQRLRRLERKRQGRKAEPTAAVMDAQSVDGCDTAGADSRGCDGATSSTPWVFGVTDLSLGSGEVPCTCLADPEDHELCVRASS